MVEEFVSDSLEHPLPFVLHDAANSGKYLHTITLFRALQPQFYLQLAVLQAEFGNMNSAIWAVGQ